MNNQNETKEGSITINFINGEKEIFNHVINDDFIEFAKAIKDDSKLSFRLNGAFYFKSAIRKIEINYYH